MVVSTHPSKTDMKVETAKISKPHSFDGMPMDQISIKVATKEDLPAILALQKKAYLSEAIIYNDFTIPPLHQSMDDIEDEFNKCLFIKLEGDGEIIGSVRGYEVGGVCYIGKLIVEPRCQNQGIGTRLLDDIESRFANAHVYELFTGHKSQKNLHIYQKQGYVISRSEQVSPSLALTYLRKKNPVYEDD